MASQNMVAGILAALIARSRTGTGQRLDTSLLGGQIWAQASEYTAYLMNGELPGRANRGNALVPGLYGMFTTSDGHIAIVGVVGADRSKFFELVGHPEWVQQFEQTYLFDDARAVIFPLLDDAFSARTTAEWCQILRDAGIRHAPVRNYAEVVDDPGAWQNGYFAQIEDAGVGYGGSGDVGERVVGSPVRFSGTPARVLGAAPELGQHTEEVLLEAGFSWEEISELSAQKAI
jgi:crotonobetainyl-CoA:carnitine CoA-transferase CaiB-like acyl-CoA transferase